ncbi:hypothetical protein ACM66B_000015 [Microbotryomycetes sp. NB124-2]
MGKRKSARKPGAGRVKQAPLDKQFKCLYCNHMGTVTCKIDSKKQSGRLDCKDCGQYFVTDTNHLTEPIDVYTDWIDASVAANSAAARRQAGAGGGAANGGQRLARADGDRPGTGAAGGGARGKSPILPGASAVRDKNRPGKQKKRRREDGYESEGIDDEDADSDEGPDDDDDEDLPDLRLNKKRRDDDQDEEEEGGSDQGSRPRLTNRARDGRAQDQEDEDEGGDGDEGEEQVQRKTRVLSDDEDE